MSDPAKAAPCCGGGRPRHEEYPYGPQPFEDGVLDTFAGPVRRVRTSLETRDRLGTLGVRLGLRRSDYRVEPGLYAAGEPDDTAPVLVSANYKLSFDALRSSLAGRSAWLLVLNTNGVNVWCAAGKGVFSTDELLRRMRDVRLEQVVSHRTLVVPQLAATGVAGHAVRAASGFRVVWGPVRASDLPAYLDAGMRATPEMRRVRFGLRDRAVLVPVELSYVVQPKVLAAIAVVLAVTGLWRAFTPAGLDQAPGGIVFGLLGGFLAGTVLVPLGLPWIPGRAFSLKGAIAGALVGGLVAWGWYEPLGALRASLLVAAAAAVASFAAMNFTGSSTYTSPSGVEHEMRRAIPLQIAGAVAGLVMLAAGFFQ